MTTLNKVTGHEMTQFSELLVTARHKPPSGKFPIFYGASIPGLARWASVSDHRKLLSWGWKGHGGDGMHVLTHVRTQDSRSGLNG